MLSFKEIFENFEQLIEAENSVPNSGKVIKLREKYSIDLEARYNCILERYKKSKGNLEIKRDYCRLASFFEAIMNWEKVESPIDLIDENGRIFSNAHNRRVHDEDLKETLTKITLDLLVRLSTKILNPLERSKAKEELAKSLDIIKLNEGDETLLSLFRSL